MSKTKITAKNQSGGITAYNVSIDNVSNQFNVPTEDKKEKKDLKKRLKHEIRPYPKNTQEFNKAIQNHTTIEPETDIKTKFW
jgi:hypothetical protein